MANISPVKTIIQSEEVAYAAAVSSGTGTRIGQGLNFHNTNQIQIVEWVLNGKYGRNIGAQENVDGAVSIWRDCEIIGFFMFNQIAGSSGVTDIDIQRYTSSNTKASIFTVRPSLSFTSGNEAYMSVWYDPTNVLENPTGSTFPTFVSRNLNAGDALALDFVTRQLDAESLTIQLALRMR